MGTDTVPEVKNEQSSTPEVTELDSKIIRQVEYYFGNYNLNKDKFLKEQITLDDGWVPLDLLTKFKRLKSLSEDFNVICEALKKSSSGLLEVNEECTKIRRSADKPLPDEATTQDDFLNRSVYVKGFKKTTTLDELLEFFKDHKAENVAMRYVKPPNKGGFKGSCFVTFETLEDAEKFLGLKGIKYQGTELLRETKKDYIKRKDELYKNLKKERENKKQQRAGNMKNVNVQELKMIPGCLLKLTGLESDIELTREDLKAPLEKFGIGFIDYSRGKPEAVIRFDTGVAMDALKGLSVEEDGVKKIEFKGVKATAFVLEGEEEEEYWKSIAVSKANRFRSGGFQKPNKGRFNKYTKKDRRGKRSIKEENDDPPSKRSKSEESSDDKGGKQESGKRESAIDDNDGPPSKKMKSEESNGNSQETAVEATAN